MYLDLGHRAKSHKLWGEYICLIKVLWIMIHYQEMSSQNKEGLWKCMSSKARTKGMKNARQDIIKNVSGMKPRWLIVLKYFYGLCILRKRAILTLVFLNVNIHVKKGKTQQQQKIISTTTSEKLSMIITNLE